MAEVECRNASASSATIAAYGTSAEQIAFPSALVVRGGGYLMQDVATAECERVTQAEIATLIGRLSPDNCFGVAAVIKSTLSAVSSFAHFKSSTDVGLKSWDTDADPPHVASAFHDAAAVESSMRPEPNDPPDNAVPRMADYYSCG